MKLKDCFTDKGAIKFDPYRLDENIQSEVMMNGIIFDEDGYLNVGIKSQLCDLIRENNWSPFCDAVGLIHAECFALNTKNNYSTIYYFR